MMHRVTAELKASGIEDAALKVGDRAPSFTLFWKRRFLYRGEAHKSSSTDKRRSIAHRSNANIPTRGDMSSRNRRHDSSEPTGNM